MRFHKSESAFFVFIGVILTASMVTLHAYSIVVPQPEIMSAVERNAEVQYLRKLHNY